MFDVWWHVWFMSGIHWGSWSVTFVQKGGGLGPPWAHSCFFYEDLNGDIHSMFHGTQNVPSQVLNAVHIQQKLPNLMGFAVRVRSAGQKYGPTCHQRDRADVTEFVTLVRLSSLGQHVGVLALAGYKHRKSARTAGPITALLPGTPAELSYAKLTSHHKVHSVVEPVRDDVFAVGCMKLCSLPDTVHNLLQENEGTIIHCEKLTGFY